MNEWERLHRQAATSDSWGGKTGLYFIDMNVDPRITDVARCITTRQDSCVTNHRGVHSAVLIEEEAESPFTVTARDQDGNLHTGRIRRLMPIECWRLQGFADEQFHKAAACGLKDGPLYKMAGNSVTVPVISAIGKRIQYLHEKYEVNSR